MHLGSSPSSLISSIPLARVWPHPKSSCFLVGKNVLISTSRGGLCEEEGVLRRVDTWQAFKFWVSSLQRTGDQVGWWQSVLRKWWFLFLVRVISKYSTEWLHDVSKQFQENAVFKCMAKCWTYSVKNSLLVVSDMVRKKWSVSIQPLHLLDLCIKDLGKAVLYFGVRENPCPFPLNVNYPMCLHKK